MEDRPSQLSSRFYRATVHHELKRTLVESSIHAYLSQSLLACCLLCELHACAFLVAIF